MRTKKYFPKLFPFISSLYHEELNDTTLSYIEDVQKDIDMDDFGKSFKVMRIKNGPTFDQHCEHAFLTSKLKLKSSSENISILLHFWLCLSWF